jgi:hypothetical protein
MHAKLQKKMTYKKKPAFSRISESGFSDPPESTINPEILFKSPIIIEKVKWDFNDDNHLHHDYALAA